MLNKNFSNRPLYGVFLSGAQKVLDRPLYIDFAFFFLYHKAIAIKFHCIIMANKSELNKVFNQQYLKILVGFLCRKLPSCMVY